MDEPVIAPETAYVTYSVALRPGARFPAWFAAEADQDTTNMLPSAANRGVLYRDVRQHRQQKTTAKETKVVSALTSSDMAYTGLQARILAGKDDATESGLDDLVLTRWVLSMVAQAVEGLLFSTATESSSGWKNLSTMDKSHIAWAMAGTSSLILAAIHAGHRLAEEGGFEGSRADVVRELRSAIRVHWTGGSQEFRVTEALRKLV